MFMFLYILIIFISYFIFTFLYLFYILLLFVIIVFTLYQLTIVLITLGNYDCILLFFLIKSFSSLQYISNYKNKSYIIRTIENGSNKTAFGM